MEKKSFPIFNVLLNNECTLLRFKKGFYEEFVLGKIRQTNFYFELILPYALTLKESTIKNLMI